MELCVEIALEEAMELPWDRLVECDVIEIENCRVRGGIV
jgi:hypothetical protein